MCGVLMLVPPVRSAPSSMSARASLSVKLSSWYRLFPSRVSLQRRTILSSTFPTGERRLASHNAAYSVEIANFYWGIDGKENYCVVRLRPLWNQLTDEKVGKVLCKAHSPFSTDNIFYWDPQYKIIIIALHLRLLVWLADCQGCGGGGGGLGPEGGVAGDVLSFLDLWHHLAVILPTGLHPAWRAKH